MRGKYRHWKTGWFTTYSFMTISNDFPELIGTYLRHWQHNIQEWDGTGDKNDTIHEGNTICKIWETDVMRINPISSLTLTYAGASSGRPIYKLERMVEALYKN
jgi:hypothetical protein